jgi:purine-binding chemotaxis protein CheW
MEQQVVVFSPANEYSGIDIAAVDGIIKMQPITMLPHMPEYVEGILNLRGTVIPVINLHKRFGFVPQPSTNDTRFVSIVLDRTRVGMMVNGVSAVLTISEADIDPAPPMVTTTNSNIIIGIAKVDERLIILLDLNQALKRKEAQPLEGISSSPPLIVPAQSIDSSGYHCLL